MSNTLFSINTCSEKDYEQIIHDLKNEVAQLRSENYQLKDLVDNLPGDIYWKDKNGIWAGMNKRCILSLKQMGVIANNTTTADIIGKTDYQIFSKRTAHGYRKNDLEVMKREMELSIQEITHLSSGEEVTLLSTKIPLRDAKKNVVGIVGNTINISHLKKIETELKTAKASAESANQAKDIFIQNMSHDIRTPLTGMIILSDLLEQKLQNPEEKECANLISASSQQLLTLLNNILDLTKNEHDQQVKISTFSINKILNDIRDLEQPSARAKNLALIINTAPSLPDLITSDYVKIHRIILNILGNALKFTEQGSIIISANAIDFSDQHCILELIISDTGIGIAPDQKDKIFDRFFKVSPSSDGLFQGYGVGLNIVQQNIRLLNGHIKLDSEPGVGTSFTMSIPVKIVSRT